MRIVILYFTFYSILISAGNDNAHYGGRSAGLAHTSVSLSDVWSTHHNQAGLGWLTQAEAGAFFQNRFLIKEMNYMGFAYAQPIKTGTFGFSFTNFGYSQYGESKVGLSYGLKLSDKITGGIQLNYHNTRIANNYGSASVLSGEMGAQAKLTSHLTLGLHLFNPTRAKLNNYNDERIPTIMRFGLNYTFSEKVFVAFEVEKDIDHRAVLRGGIEYKTNDMFYLRAGVGSNPSIFSFGAGIYTKQFKFDIAAGHHQILGFTPEISFSYLFNKKNN